MDVIDVYACEKCGAFAIVSHVCCGVPVTEVLEGVTEAFAETGTEGILWSFFDLRHEDPRTGMRSYHGLHTLQDGDRLTIHSVDGAAPLEITVELDWEIGWQPYPHWAKQKTFEECKSEGLGQQQVAGYWVHGLQRGMVPLEWAKLFAHPGTRCSLRKARKR